MANKDQTSADSPPRLNPWWFASALGLVWAFYWGCEYLYAQWRSNWPPDQAEVLNQRGEALNRLGLVSALALAFGLLWCRGSERGSSRWRQAAIIVPLAAFFALHAERWYVTQHNAITWVEDVGETSIAADRGLVRGINPYAARLNPLPNWYMSNANGYKYFPFTMAVYFPGAMLARDGEKYGARAVLATNMLLTIVAAALLAVSAGKWISPDAGLLCALLFFLSRIISLEQVRQGANDIIPMVLVFLALLNLRRRWWCGFLVGLAVCAKFLPGLLWITICLTPFGKRRYLGAIACGLLPCVPFLLWAPGPFIRNSIVFPLGRPREQASVFFWTPHWMQIGAEAAGLGIFVLYAWRAARTEIPPLRRCMHAAALTLMFQCVSPDMHQNYFIWWYMPLCVSFTALVFNPACYEWISRSHISR